MAARVFVLNTLDDDAKTFLVVLVKTVLLPRWAVGWKVGVARARRSVVCPTCFSLEWPLLRWTTL